MARKQGFQVGDVVKLVAGGPLATVVHVNAPKSDADDPNYGMGVGDVTVAWTANGVPHRQTHPPAALRPAREKKAPPLG